MSTAHWETVYTTESPETVSWYAPHLRTSLEFLEAAGLPRYAGIVDVGDGASGRTPADCRPLPRQQPPKELPAGAVAPEGVEALGFCFGQQHRHPDRTLVLGTPSALRRGQGLA